VFDSRGNTTIETITIPMVEYVPLTCSIDGEITLDAADGTKANITFTVSGNYFNGSFGAVDNTLELSYSIEDSSGGIFLEPLPISEATFSGTTYSLTYTIPRQFDYKNSYTIKVQAKDKINSLESLSKTLKAVPVFDWSEEDFNFNVPVKIDGVEIADYVIEQGEKDGWLYRKWRSGKGECWKTVEVNTTITNAWGNMYSASTKMERQDYPFQFKTKPIEMANLNSGYYAAFLYAEGNGGEGVNGAYSSAIYGIGRPTTATTAASYYITIYAFGILQ
jgi:hypothetical protein